MANHLKEKHYLQDNQEMNHSSAIVEKVKSIKQTDKTRDNILHEKVKENLSI